MAALRKFWFPLAVIVVTVGALWWTNLSVTPKKASWEDVLAEAGRGGYKIITVEELGTRFREAPERLLLVDTRQEWEFRTGHIKGALSFPMEPTWLSRWRKSETLGSLLGPDKNRLIVFY